ncbi:LCD1 [Candida pseudojiufengensis]|uniref:LCD1 n=1 Tax=Candida pseudojiufengensis TaxID=497109 RepID=UPI0022249CFC|nr:LCD1 [Candida pseudojiufengensis]KAI5964600.1 LCD1 [Candida pseudojiufengensis]
MTSSDNDFDDEDDELLQEFLIGKTQIPSTKTQQVSNTTITPQTTTVPLASQYSNIPLNNEIQNKLFQADGEIATLKAQILQLQNSKREEISQLKQSFDALKRSKESETIALNEAINKLEDDRKFLKNELITSNALKKRKITNGFTQVPPQQQQIRSNTRQNNEKVGDKKGQDARASTPDSSLVIKPIQQVQLINPTNETAKLIEQLWKYSIVGSPRKSFDYLSKICFDFDMETSYGYKIKRRQSLSSSIMEVLMTMKDLKINEMIEKFTLFLLDIIIQSLDKKSVVSIPYLISLIFCIINFSPDSVSKTVIIKLIQQFSKLSKKYLFLLNPNLEEEVDFENYHDVPNQVIAIEKYILICSFDLIEKLISISSTYDIEFIKKIWSNQILTNDLIKTCLPQNEERFKTVAQINIMFNIVEMLSSSITEDTFGFNEPYSDVSMITSLMKIFTIDIPIKDGFKFFGLNRFLGNNFDMKIIDSTIPIEHDKLGNYLIVIPQPIYKVSKQIIIPSNDLEFNHEKHLLNLKIKVAELLISIIITKQTIEFLHNKEYFKSFIRILLIEQIYITKTPRSKLIHYRIHLIGLIVRIINYLTQDLHEANDLIYSQTMYEIFVVLSRIAFGSDSLSIDAHKLLTKIRSKGHYNISIFNENCEKNSRQMNHLTIRDFEKNGKLLADIESDYANGFEFPYESETVELSREILNRFVNHEEADNLYFNMNYESDNDDEMNDMDKYNRESDEEMGI